MTLPDWLNTSKNPNDFFSNIEFWLVRGAVFLIFLVGLGKVGWELLLKVLR